MKQIIIEGMSGAGKTPLVEQLEKDLKADGYYVIVCAPFTIANSQIAAWYSAGTEWQPKNGIFDYWGASEEHAFTAFNHIISIINNTVLWTWNVDHDLDKVVIIWDRHWMTLARGIEDSLMNSISKNLLMSVANGHADTPMVFMDTTKEMTQSRQSWNPDIPWTTGDLIDYDMGRRRELLKLATNKLVINVDQPRIDLVHYSNLIRNELMGITK